ncbi:MAG: aldose 1-epimerase family protein [Sarcina sp.]
MLYKLENEFLTITTHENGGELHSITSKMDNTEFLWNGDPTYWKYHAPILFPIVGKVRDGKYTVDGKVYELPQHGLARISKFNLLNKSENEISFELKFSDETLKVYPYKFSLIITYTLEDKKVITSYKVTNIDDKTIDFSIGAHPAYMCPLLENENLTDYYFEFNEKETTSLMALNVQNGLFKHEKIEYLQNENKIPLSKDLFENDALVFDCKELKSNKISVKTNNHNKFIEFDFTGFSHLGLWAPATGAPFLCIEPWFGHADFEDFQDDFKNKPGILSLEPKKEFTCSYSVTIHN